MAVITSQKKLTILVLLVSSLCNFSLHAILSAPSLMDDLMYDFSGLFKPEMFYGKNISFLNDNNCYDRVIYFRHTLDFTLDVAYGAKTYGHDALEFYCTMRNRTIWGNPRGVAQTTPSVVKISESVTSPHNHYIPRNISWFREIWMMWDIADFFHLNLPTKHTFKIGSFPYNLGRGIALGDNYGSGPEVLGFFTDDAVDQYAFGGLLNGWLVDQKLNYDLYATIWQNRSSTSRDTGERILAQEYMRQTTPERGFGSVNFLVSGQLNWTVFSDGIDTKLTCQPYALFNDDPEQRVQFPGDARSYFGTIGLCSDYEGKFFGCGFDTAVNCGHQDVKGWDRNIVEINNVNAALTEVNTQVIYQNPNDSADKANGKRIPYIPGGAAQTIINASSRSAACNNQQIGSFDASNGYGYLPGPIIYLQNSKIRFRDPYRNEYKGWMCVADGALKTYHGDLQFAGAVGVASGDDNPNTDTIDGTYDGFIGLQEIYSGKRVRSAYVLGSRKLKRPFSFPIDTTGSFFAQSTSDFTDLRFIGGGVTFRRQWPDGCKVYVHQSIIAYWKDFPVPAFNAVTGKACSEFAETFEGTEINLFVDIFLMRNLKLYFVGAVFLPGNYFFDIRGEPLSADQVRALDRFDRSGILNERIPNIGTDTALTYNIGVEYRF